MVKKKICLVITNPLTIVFFHLGQIAALARNYDLTVITNTRDPDFLSHLNAPLRVLPVGMERPVSPWRDLKSLLRLIVIFYRERFDLVHSVTPKSGLLAMLAAWITRIPLRIHTFQGEVWITRRGVWRMFLKFFDKLVAHWATHILVVSASETQFLVEQGILPPGKGKVLAQGSICGVDTARFRPDIESRKRVRTAIGIAETDLVILFLGRLTVDKGVMDLVTAFFRILPRYTDAHLLIVGPDEENMRKQIEAQYSAEMTNLHFVDYTDVPERYMAASDIVCLPSYREGFGLVLIEAAASGIPTIGSKIYGITDAIVDLETGLLFSVGNIDDLTQKIENLLADPELRITLGIKGRTRALNQFSKEFVLSELLGFYAKVLTSDPAKLA